MRLVVSVYRLIYTIEPGSGDVLIATILAPGQP